jgi:hypothetical protein
MTCARVTKCPLFPLFSMRASLLTWRASYCDADFARCERLRRSEAGLSVPANLLPNGKLLAMAQPHAASADE